MHNIESILVMVGQAIVLVYAFVMTTVNLVRPERGVSAPVFISIFVMVASIFLLIRRETYLPFLGPAAIPTRAFKETLIPDKANVQAIVSLPNNVPDGTPLLYWGANPTDPSSIVVENPWKAYKDFKNTGIVPVYGNKATIVFHCPSKYKTPMGITLDRHVHYRLLHRNGMMGPVETAKVTC